MAALYEMIGRFSPNIRYLLGGALSMAAPRHSFFAKEGARGLEDDGDEVEEQGGRMQDRLDESSGPFWTEGDMMLRVQGLRREVDRILTLAPAHSADAPWELGSELVFLGWSSSCGIQIKDKLAARAHCAIVRTPTKAFLVDLCGQNLWVGDQAVNGIARLHDGDVLTIG